MAAPRRIEWSARAENDLERIYDFVKARWTEREAERLLDLVQEFETLISKWPNGFKRSPSNKHFRLGLVHRNTTAVYRVYRDRIMIITLFDNRSNASR
jgi:plasmid stabilization system protein ParE